MVTVKINGMEVTVSDNTLILEAARDAGYEVPTFCYQADLMGVGSCRMCLVEIEGQKKLQPSCITPVMQGMSILTESRNVQSARADMLEFLLANHAMDCPVCDKGGECELQDMVHKYGPHAGKHAEKKFKFLEKDYALSPVIVKNSNRCVQCMRCVRVCREVVGTNVLAPFGRGDHQEQSSFLRNTLDCDHCGNCIEVCPVGCFMRMPYRYKSRPWDLKSADTVCPYCATGCRMVIEQRDGVVMRSRAQFGVGMNSETLCARGRFGYDVINSADRLKTPLVRRGGKLEEATWEEALEAIRENLTNISGKRLGGIASARLTNEELYLFQKLMREMFGSPNVDSSLRWKADGVEGYILAMDTPGGGVSMFDAVETDSVFIIGSQLSEENPVTDYIVRRISANRRMNVIIASVRSMKLDSSANVSVRHMPGAEGALLQAIIHVVVSENAERLKGHEGAKAIAAKSLKEILDIAGVTEEEVRNIVTRLGRSATVGVFAGTEFLRFPRGAAPLFTFISVMRALDKKVIAVPVLDRCNQRGAWEMGVHPGFGPGYAPVAERGLDAAGMIAAADNGDIDGLYLIGANPVAAMPDEDYVINALRKLKFLVVQDTFMSETAKIADVVLPSALSGEKDGTFTNQEGRVQSIKKLLNPPGKAKRDLDILSAIGSVFDRTFSLASALSVLAEIRANVKMYTDVDLTFLNRKNLENKLDIKDALVKGLLGARINPYVCAQADAAGAAASSEKPPFRLITGNHLYFSGRLSRRSETLRLLLKTSIVEIGEEDASELGLGNGDMVVVTGKSHEVKLMLRTHRGWKKGVAFIAENLEDANVNRFFKCGCAVPRVSIKRA